jgi:hypothetical protein
MEVSQVGTGPFSRSSHPRGPEACSQMKREIDVNLLTMSFSFWD